MISYDYYTFFPSIVPDFADIISIIDCTTSTPSSQWWRLETLKRKHEECIWKRERGRESERENKRKKRKTVQNSLERGGEEDVPDVWAIKLETN